MIPIAIKGVASLSVKVDQKIENFPALFIAMLYGWKLDTEELTQPWNLIGTGNT